MHGRGDGHRRVTELAQDGEFKVAVAFALATAPPIAVSLDVIAVTLEGILLPIALGILNEPRGFLCTRMPRSPTSSSFPEPKISFRP